MGPSERFLDAGAKRAQELCRNLEFLEAFHSITRSHSMNDKLNKTPDELYFNDAFYHRVVCHLAQMLNDGYTVDQIIGSAQIAIAKYNSRMELIPIVAMSIPPPSVKEYIDTIHMRIFEKISGFIIEHPSPYVSLAAPEGVDFTVEDVRNTPGPASDLINNLKVK